MSTRVVVAGTDTDIGKTVFAAAFVQALDGVLLEAGASRPRRRNRLRKPSAVERPQGLAHFARDLPPAHGRIAARRGRA